MTTLREAGQQALEALTIGCDAAYEVAQTYHASMAGYRPARHLAVDEDVRKIESAISALSAALAQPAPEPQCNPHPKAPHGFLRNASHTEDRYVCECKYWEPYEAGYQAAMEAAHAQPESEPVGVVTSMVKGGVTWHRWPSDMPDGTLLYTAPPQQPAPEPVAYIHRQGNHWEVSERFLCDDEKARGWTEEPLYTAPPQQPAPPQRKPLAEDEMRTLADKHLSYQTESYEVSGVFDLIRAVEAAHGIKE